MTITEREMNVMHIEAQAAVQKLLEDTLREFQGDRAEEEDAEDQENKPPRA